MRYNDNNQPDIYRDLFFLNLTFMIYSSTKGTQVITMHRYRNEFHSFDLVLFRL